MADDAVKSTTELLADVARLQAENAVLRADLATRDGALATSHEQQAATAEVLRVIASSPTDLQYVLSTIAEAGMRLCGAEGAALQQRVGDRLEGLVHAGARLISAHALTSISYVPISNSTFSGRAILTRRTVCIDDVDAVGDEFAEGRALAQSLGVRSAAYAPLLHRDQVIGVLALHRFEPHGFGEQQLALLETFADQAVIAIENARLFQELQQRTSDLTEALEQVNTLTWGKLGLTPSTICWRQ